MSETLTTVKARAGGGDGGVSCYLKMGVKYTLSAKAYVKLILHAVRLQGHLRYHHFPA